jgi:hypothetical protein
VGSCEHDNELPGSIKTGKLLDYLSDYQLLKADFASCTRVYQKVSGLSAWSESCKWYSPLPLGAVVSLFCESV